MLNILLHEEHVTNSMSDMEIVKANKRRLLEIQREYYEKKAKEIEQRKREEVMKEVTASPISTSTPLTDIEQAKANKKKVEEMQVKYFLAKYDVAKSKANQIKVKQMQQLYQNQKSDLQLVKRNKERCREIQKDYCNQNNNLQLGYQIKHRQNTSYTDQKGVLLVEENKRRYQEIHETYKNQKGDLQLVKENKKRLKEIQDEYYNRKNALQSFKGKKERKLEIEDNSQKSDLQLVEENKRRYQEIQDEARRKQDDLMFSYSYPNLNSLSSGYKKVQEGKSRSLSNERNTLSICNLQHSDLNINEKEIKNALITNCKNMSITLNKEIKAAKIEGSKDSKIILPNDFKGSIHLKNCANITVMCETKETFNFTKFTFDQTSKISINIMKAW